MKKKLVMAFVLMAFLVVPLASSGVSIDVRINEVELNPAGNDSGNEWVEFFSESGVDLNGLYLENAQGNERYDLSGNFTGYFFVIFSSQWLDNTNEKVFLKDSFNNTIDQTIFLNDSDNNNMAWSFCDTNNSIWQFIPSTKGGANECASDPGDGGSGEGPGNETNVTIDLVNVEDLLDLLADWGPCSGVNGSFCEVDFNEDGNISSIDLEILLASWGQELNVSFGDPDVNGDGNVDVTDLLQVLAAFGPCGEGNCSSDILIDGVVNSIDLKILIASWGQGSDVEIPIVDIVDVTDLISLLSFWGVCEGGNCTKYDFNENGEIDSNDLNILRELWGIDWGDIEEFFLANSPDINGDGVVNVSDLLALLAAWNECPSEANVTCPADIFGDGIVDSLDLEILRAFWGVFEGDDDSDGGDDKSNTNPSGGGSSRNRLVASSPVEEGGLCRSDWDCSDWSSCSEDGEESRSCIKVEEGCYAGAKPETIRSCESLSEEGNGFFSFITGAVIGSDGKPNTKGVLAFIIALVVVYFIVGFARKEIFSASASKAVTKPEKPVEEKSSKAS